MIFWNRELPEYQFNFCVIIFFQQEQGLEENCLKLDHFFIRYLSVAEILSYDIIIKDNGCMDNYFMLLCVRKFSCVMIFKIPQKFPLVSRHAKKNHLLQKSTYCFAHLLKGSGIQGGSRHY